MCIVARHIVAIALVLLLALLTAACGDDSATPSEPAAPAGGDAAASSEPEDQPDDESTDEAVPTAAQQAAGRGLERLAKAFAPVSARINFLVTAETLRADAVDSNAGDEIERERAGVVRIEIDRMQDVLASARPRVAAVPVSTTAQQQVQQLLLEAIDARSRAMTELVAALNAVGAGMGDRVVEERFSMWEASWDASLRATREATTTVQDARADLGLAPAPEEQLR